MRALLSLVPLVLLVSCGPRPHPTCRDLCDPETEFCVVRVPCSSFLPGEPTAMPWRDNYTCLPLPDRCLDDVSCNCTQCRGELLDGEQEECWFAPLDECTPREADGPVIWQMGCLSEPAR